MILCLIFMKHLIKHTTTTTTNNNDINNNPRLPSRKYILWGKHELKLKKKKNFQPGLPTWKIITIFDMDLVFRMMESYARLIKE